MDIKVIKDQLSRDEIKALAQETFGDMVKIVVDVEKKILAIGGELHVDAEAILLESGSEQKNLWGANIFPDRPSGEQIEFTSLINIRPKQGNKQTELQDPELRKQVAQVIHERLAL